MRTNGRSAQELSITSFTRRAEVIIFIRDAIDE